jgi:hypothetical protein
MSKNIFNVENLFRYDYGGEPKFDRMVKPGSKLHTVLSQTGERDILSILQQKYPKKNKRNKPKTQRKKKKNISIRNKSMKNVKKKVKKKI